jgi:hypothetical protein
VAPAWNVSANYVSAGDYAGPSSPSGVGLMQQQLTAEPPMRKKQKLIVESGTSTSTDTSPSSICSAKCDNAFSSSSAPRGK